MKDFLQIIVSFEDKELEQGRLLQLQGSATSHIISKRPRTDISPFKAQYLQTQTQAWIDLNHWVWKAEAPADVKPWNEAQADNKKTVPE